jgi:hypothetical protein
MECKFVVGQQVVCTKKELWYSDVAQKYYPPGIGPQFNEIVTIKEIDLDSLRGNIYLFVSGHRGSFNHIHFKPVDHPKTDISIFNKLLNPSSDDIKKADFGPTPYPKEKVKELELVDR